MFRYLGGVFRLRFPGGWVEEALDAVYDYMTECLGHELCDPSAGLSAMGLDNWTSRFGGTISGEYCGRSILLMITSFYGSRPVCMHVLLEKARWTVGVNNSRCVTCIPVERHLPDMAMLNFPPSSGAKKQHFFSTTPLLASTVCWSQLQTRNLRERVIPQADIAVTNHFSFSWPRYQPVASWSGTCDSKTP